MPLFYCLAKTAVNGEVIIQGSSVTYSASASAFASANTSFKDAAKVATIDSNTAATIAARKTVDDILKNYAYVLADENITEMINNSLKTTITPITPILLKKIAKSTDDKIYTLRKATTIAETEYLLIPTGKKLIVPSNFIFNNEGLIQLGGDIPTPPTNKTNTLKAGGSGTCLTTDAGTPCCVNNGCSGGLSIYSPSVNKGSINVAANTCLEFFVSYSNLNTVTNSGCIQLLSGALFANSTNPSKNLSGLVINSGGTFYSN